MLENRPGRSYRACYLLSHRCEDVLSGHKRTVFNDPSIDKRFSSVLDFAALRMVGGYYRPPFLFVGWNLCKVSEFFERKRCRVALLQRSARTCRLPAISALQGNARKGQNALEYLQINLVLPVVRKNLQADKRDG